MNVRLTHPGVRVFNRSRLGRRDRAMMGSRSRRVFAGLGAAAEAGGRLPRVQPRQNDLTMPVRMKHFTQVPHSDTLAASGRSSGGRRRPAARAGVMGVEVEAGGRDAGRPVGLFEAMSERGEEISGLLLPLGSGGPTGGDGYQQVSELELEVKGAEEVRIIDGKEQVTVVEPSWSGLKRKAASVLAKDSKHLRAALVYAYCRLRLDQWEGLRDGLELVASLLERFWEDLHPRLAPDEDPFERSNILEDLALPVNTPGDPYNFVLHIQRLPLTNSGRHGAWSHLEIIAARKTSRSTEGGASAGPSAEEIERARVDSAAEFRSNTLAAIEATRAALSRIRAAFEGRATVPNLGLLERVLGELQTWLATPVGEAVGASASTGNGQDVAHESASPTGTEAQTGPVASRAQAIGMLRAVKRYYDAAEPSSPVPFLIALAINVSQRDFVKILKKLPPSSVDELTKIFGETVETDGDQ